MLLRVIAISALIGLLCNPHAQAGGAPSKAVAAQNAQEGRPGAELNAGVEELERMKLEVEAFLNHYIKVLESRDERAIRALFVPDERFAWFTDGVRRYSTPDQLLAGMRTYGEVRFQTRLSQVRVLRLAAGMASAESSFETKMTFAGASPAEFGGVITWLLENDSKSGRWRVVQGHTSTPGGPPAQSPPRSQR